MRSKEMPDEQSLELRTGRATVPLAFAESDGEVYLVAQHRSAQWPVDILRTGRASLLLQGRTIEGVPTLVTSPADRDRILELFRSKYGGERFAEWYRHPARVLRVTPTGSGSSADRPASAYYDWLRAEFDNVAADYDRHITGNRMNRLLRDRSLQILGRRFRDCRRVLEIGCGSGMETLPMLEQGHEVLAVDISGEMLATVRAKAARAGVAERLTTCELAAHDLERLLDTNGAGSFDGAYSTFGALNCEPELTGIPPVLARLLRPGAPFLAGIYNRWCLFELGGYALTLQGRRAVGRRRNPVPVGASRFCIDVYAYSVADFQRLFLPFFDRERVEGVPVLLPPSDLTRYADRFAGHFDQLAALDAAAGRRWPLNRLGDHFLASYARRP